MGNATAVTTCRSYSAQAFDGCTGCVDMALDAIEQAGLYTVARVAPGLEVQPAGPAQLAYDLRVRLYDDDGNVLGSDELEAEQTIETVAAGDGLPSAGDDEAEPESTPSTMRLDDFQTVMESLQLTPAGHASVAGSVVGTLFGFERLVGRFDIEIVAR